jgi:hypothetical protein
MTKVTHCFQKIKYGIGKTRYLDESLANSYTNFRRTEARRRKNRTIYFPLRIAFEGGEVGPMFSRQGRTHSLTGTRVRQIFTRTLP